MADKQQELDEEVRISPRTGKPIDKRYSHRNTRKINRNSPVIGMNGYDLEDGDNTKFLSLNVELFNMPEIDKYDPEAVAKRLEDYFNLHAKYDMKPTVAGMAMALGMNRRTLIAIVNDYATGSTGYKSALPRSVTLIIKKAYFILENLWENYTTSGKLNPVTAIFLAKNNFHYQDKVEHVVAPEVDQDTIDVEAIKQRYIEDK